MKHVLIVLAACAALILTACGGGGGRSVMTPMTPIEPMTPAPPQDVGPAGAFDEAVDRTEGAPAIPTDAIGDLATIRPPIWERRAEFLHAGLGPGSGRGDVLQRRPLHGQRHAAERQFLQLGYRPRCGL